jgi:TPR repeat protein
MAQTLAIALFAAAALLPVAAFADTPAPGTYEEGLALYESQRYPDAISVLAIAGENGDIRAQELLGMMYLYGEQACGTAVKQDVGLARGWLYRASAQGSRIAVWTLARMDDGRPMPVQMALVQSEASGE